MNRPRDGWRCTIVRAAMAVEPGGYLQDPGREKQEAAAGIYVLLGWHDRNTRKHVEQARVVFTDVARRHAE